MTSSIGRWLPAVAVSLTLTAGCSSSVPDDASATTRPTTTATTTPQQADEAAVRKLAQDWRSASSRLLDKPDPVSPLLDRYLVGELRRTWVVYLRDLIARQVGTRLPANSRTSNRIVSVAVDGQRATIRQCEVDDGILFDLRTGKTLDDSVSTSDITTVAQKSREGWRLASETATETAGVSGCALAE